MIGSVLSRNFRPGVEKTGVRAAGGRLDASAFLEAREPRGTEAATSPGRCTSRWGRFKRPGRLPEPGPRLFTLA